jgi:hypothetical protein
MPTINYLFSRQQPVMLGILLFLFCCGCNSVSTQSEPETIVIGGDVNTERFDDFFRFSHTIALETNDDNLISDVGKIYINNHGIFILDNSKRILVFDRDGKYKELSSEIVTMSKSTPIA